MEQSEDHHEYCVGGFDPDDIVISGIAGRFPFCNKIAELKESLYKKKNLITLSDERFEKGTSNFPHSSCQHINNLDKFDNNFFRIPQSLASVMDPGARVHMEVVYEAIADADLVFWRSFAPGDRKKAIKHTEVNVILILFGIGGI